MDVQSFPHPNTISGISEIAADFDLVLCDSWGVLTNGIVLYTAASYCLRRLGESGASVVILSNTSRRSSVLLDFLSDLGLARGAGHVAYTSGEAALDALLCWSDALGRPARYLPVGDSGGAEWLWDSGFRPAFAAAQADVLVATGALPDEAAWRRYLTELEIACANGAPLICANPDRYVMSGVQRLVCARYAAELYSNLGGRVELCGKPNRTFYEGALSRIGHVGMPQKVLAIGDNLDTDILGANSMGYQSVLVTKTGVYSDELDPADWIFGASKYIDMQLPDYVMGELRW